MSWDGNTGAGADPANPVQTAPAPSSVDTFGREMVAEPVQTFASSHDQGDESHLWFEELTGGATIALAQERAAMVMTVNAEGDKAVLETRQCIPYRTGQAQHPTMTFVLGAPTPNVRRRLGAFDDNDGIFFEDWDGQGYSMVIRSSAAGGGAVDTRIGRADWNGYKFQGEGPYGITADPTKGQIWDCFFSWLGMGDVRTRFGIPNGFATAHTFHHTNDVERVYMRAGSMPLRYEIEATGPIAGPATFEAVCSSVERFGSEKEPGISTAVDSDSPVSLNLNVPQAVLGLRLRPENLLCSFSDFVPQVMACDNATAARYKWELLLDPTIDAADQAAWAAGWEDDPRTMFAQRNRPTEDIVITPDTGILLAAGVVSGGRAGSISIPRVSENLPLARRDRNTSQEAILVVTPIVDAVGLSAAAAINFREQH